VRRVFLGGQVTSLLGDGLALLAIPLLVLQLTRSPLAAGLASAMRSVGYLVFGVLAGPVVDRVTAWRVLVAADAVRALAFTALGVLAWLRLPQIGLILGIAFAAACASVFFDAALAITVQDLFPRDQLVTANSAIETSSQMARIIGPVAAAMLATTAGIQDALWIDAATFVVSLSTVGVIFRSRGHPPATARGRGLAGGSRRLSQGFWRDFAAGLRYLRTQRLILALTVLFAITNLCLGADTLLVYFGRITLNLSAVTVSGVIAAGGAAGVAGALAASRLAARFNRVALVTGSVAVAGAAVAAMAAARSWWQLAAANAALLFAAALGSLLVRSIRQELVPREMLGRVTAAARTLFVSATPLGSLIASAATTAHGGNPRPVFLVAGCVLAVSAGVTWRVTLRHHASGARPEENPGTPVTATGG
jgi:MFS family permease